VVFGVARRVIGEVPLESIFKGIIPFLLAVVAGIIVLMIFPQIILFLPNLMY
jgi:TRAP-type C4-dicarboxylate transport system permease large subunit